MAIIQAKHSLLFATDSSDNFLETFRLNFPSVKSMGASATTPTDIPHPDVACGNLRNEGSVTSLAALLSPIMPRAIVVESSKADPSPIWRLGYVPYEGRLDATRYGLPQRRIMRFFVAFRQDVRRPSQPFLFPAGDRVAALRDVVEESPDLALDISDKAIAGAARRAEANRANGLRFHTKVLSGDDVMPALSPRYARDKTSFFLQGPRGPRRMSLVEGKRVMGFPDMYALPSQEGNAFAQLAESTCPPVAQALVEEVVKWVF